MCHPDNVVSLPKPGPSEHKSDHGLWYWEYLPSANTAAPKLSIITDIYGGTEFYKGFATFFQQKGWHVYLIDLFHDFGELREATREVAFERRHRLKDQSVCDKLESLITSHSIDAVIGFCLGGNYVLELARRHCQAKLVGYYPFPAGLPNQEALPEPFDYVSALTSPVTALVGDKDDAAGRDNIAKFAEIAKSNSALTVKVYEGSGHGFLGDLDSDDDQLRSNAQNSLLDCEQAITR